MNAEVIENGLKGVLGREVRFLGCFHEKDLLEIISREKGVFVCIVLVGGESASVGHWIGLYVNHYFNKIGYFDSYNLPPSSYSTILVRYINMKKDYEVCSLNFRLQSNHSYVCGAYAMLFVYLISHHNLNMVLSFFKKKFSRHSYFENDKLILRLCYSLFKMPPCIKTFCLGETKYIC